MTRKQNAAGGEPTAQRREAKKSNDYASNVTLTRRKNQLERRLDELDEILGQLDPDTDSAWIDAYQEYLDVSAELIGLGVGDD